MDKAIFSKARRGKMKEIKAFVGHSFTASDAAVVRKFTDYFDALSQSHPQFSWEHAESAEPRILTDKVLRIIADKNTFIGICTRKERVAQPHSFLPLTFRSEYWKLKRASVAWKTSDWIIQEIGLAIGKGMSVILLVEQDVRDPGGLQGDIEYISFRRESPEEAFGKILQMLTALSPKTHIQLPAVSEELSHRSDEPIEADSRKSREVPATTWSRNTYEMAAFIAIGDGDEDRLEQLTSSYKANPRVYEADEEVSWDVMIEFFRLRVGKGGKLGRLKELVDRNPSCESFKYLALIYSGFDQHDLSADAYIKAADAAKDQKREAGYIGKAIDELVRGKQLNRIPRKISRLKRLAENAPVAEGELLHTLARLAEGEEDYWTQLVLLERLVEIQPDNHEVRFNLAFKYSEQSQNDLAAYHYSMLPAAERSSTAWNNLGAALDQASMPAKAVDAYTVASEMGETLAMSNLGYKYMTAGFLKEARAEYEKASQQSDPHKNVGQLLASLQAVPDQEDETRKGMLDLAKRRVAFLHKVGAAVASEELPALAHTWQGADCSMQLTRSGRSISLSGTYERSNPFGGLGLLGMSPANADGKLRYKLLYSGLMKGRAVIGQVTRSRDGGVNVFDPSAPKQLLMYFSSDGNEIDIMVGGDTDSPTYECLKQVAK